MKAKDFKRIARENLRGSWFLSIIVSLIAMILGGIMGPLLLSLPHFAPFSILLGAAFLAITGPLQLGYCQYLLKQHDHVPFQFKDLFSQFHRFRQGFAQYFLVNLYTALWSLLLIVPGIIKALSYSMTPFIMADDPNMSVREAIDESRILMETHKAELLWLILSFTIWYVISCFTYGIGFLFLCPYMSAAYAAFYRYVKNDKYIPPAHGNDRYEKLLDSLLMAKRS